MVELMNHQVYGWEECGEPTSSMLINTNNYYVLDVFLCIFLFAFMQLRYKPYFG